MSRIYLDHAASTPLKPAVREAMVAFMADESQMANPSSAHTWGRASHQAIEEMRERVAEHFACGPGEVTFNGGGSEGDTHALVGSTELLGRACHIAISAIEHEAVMETALHLERQGHKLSLLPVDGNGVLEFSALEELLHNDRPDIVSVMAVNNEIGTVQPVAEVARLCAEHEVIYHCDAVRAVGHGLDKLIRNPLIPLLNATAHKFGGPRGSGVLVVRNTGVLKGRQFPPLIRGGGQESGRRAGTENLVGIAGFATALELATDAEGKVIDELRRRLESELVGRIPSAQIHGRQAMRATGVTSVSLKPKSGYKLQAALDEWGVCVGTGSACHDDGRVSISPVLKTMGAEELAARGTLRLSVGWNTTWQDVETALSHIEELVFSGDEGLNCEI